MSPRAAVTLAALTLLPSPPSAAEPIGPPDVVSALELGRGRPLSLAAADFDGDGLADLACGHAVAGAGMVTLQPGNPRPSAASARPLEPFRPPVRVAPLPLAPTWLAAGDFDADGHLDLVAAESGGDALAFLRGDGRGGFAPTLLHPLDGVVTALAAGEVNRRDGLADLAVGVRTPLDARVLIFQSPLGALGAVPEAVPLGAEASAFGFGQLAGDRARDLLVATTGGGFLVEGRDRRLTRPAAARARVAPPSLRALAGASAGPSPAPDALRLHLDHDAVLDRVVLAEGADRPLVIPGASGGTVFTVGSAGDAGDADLSDGLCGTAGGGCTLRAAIEQANFLAGLDTITFAIPGPSVLTPSSIFTITDPVTIDGTTQPGSAGAPVVALDGSLLGGGAILTLGAGSDGSTVRGLTLHSAPDVGLLISGSGGHLVEGNHVGTDASGTADLGNGAGGIRITGAVTGITIGGTTAAARNLISGNGGPGVEITDSPTGNTVAGNYVGTDVSGSADLGNDGPGVLTWVGNTIGGTTSGAGNVISHNGAAGVEIKDDDNLVQGNHIGTDAAGSSGAGNAGDGVFLTTPGSLDSLIGGTAAGAGNLISANGESGIEIGVGRFTLIQGNLVGTDLGGTADLGNAGFGVEVFFGFENTIGGVAAGAGNLVSGNDGGGVVMGTMDDEVLGNRVGTDAAGTGALGNTGRGIWAAGTDFTIGGAEAGAGNVVGANSGEGIFVGSDSLVQGNSVGTDAGGSLDLGNGGDGIHLAGVRNLVGGAVGAANTVAWNGGDGVAVESFTSLNRISSNALFSNDGLAIDLEEDGVTPNDAGDGDAGANDLQNFPVLTAADADAGTISGSLDSQGDTTFTLEVFASAACDPLGHGEAERFLGSGTAMTDGGGTATFTLSSLAAFADGEQITATATDPDGNTSELSACLEATGTGLIFSDGFESGNTSAWSSTVP